MALDIRISRDSDVPLHQQLSAQIVLRIGTGDLKPGDVLPSIRGLARQLGIHHNTVAEAYQDRVLGMLVVKRPGSRLVVRDRSHQSPGPAGDLDGVVDMAIQVAREQGYSTQQLVERFRERLLAAPPDHILVVSDDAGMRLILPAELKGRFDRPIQACSPAEVISDRDLLVGALLLSPPGHLPKFDGITRAERPAFPIVYASIADHIDRIRQLAGPSLIAVVSISEYFLETALAVFAPAAGDQHSLRGVLLSPNETDSVGAADLIFCDSLAYTLVRDRHRKTTVVRHQLISTACLDQIAGVLSEDQWIQS